MEPFEKFRPRLFAIAYRMLGSSMEAEDAVQDTYLRLQSADVDTIQSPEAFLRTVVTRLCLDRLRAARERRETYTGGWLPEPILTADLGDPADQVEQHEAISTAFLLLLESLSPEERAVFVLRDVFDYEYTEIAAILNKSETACRQLLSRAKKHIVDHRPRFPSSPDVHRQFLVQFMQAVTGDDLAGLTALLTEDVVALGDGGGKMPVARYPLHGPGLVAQFILGLQRRYKDILTATVTSINGSEAILLCDAHGRLDTLMTFEITTAGIKGIYLLRNPDKLQRLTSQLNLKGE